MLLDILFVRRHIRQEILKRHFITPFEMYFDYRADFREMSPAHAPGHTTLQQDLCVWSVCVCGDGVCVYVLCSDVWMRLTSVAECCGCCSVLHWCSVSTIV